MFFFLEPGMSTMVDVNMTFFLSYLIVGCISYVDIHLKVMSSSSGVFFVFFVFLY